MTPLKVPKLVTFQRWELTMGHFSTLRMTMSTFQLYFSYCGSKFNDWSGFNDLFLSTFNFKIVVGSILNVEKWHTDLSGLFSTLKNGTRTYRVYSQRWKMTHGPIGSILNVEKWHTDLSSQFSTGSKFNGRIASKYCAICLLFGYALLRKNVPWGRTMHYTSLNKTIRVWFS